MALELLVAQAIQACPAIADASPDSIAEGAQRPYAVWALRPPSGGPQAYVDGTPWPIRHALLEVHIWADTRLQASQAVQRLSEDLAMHDVLQVTAGEPDPMADPELRLYGARVEFDVWGPRGAPRAR